MSEAWRAFGPVHPELLVGVGLAALVYLRAARSSRAATPDGGRVAARDVACFLGGLAVFVVALTGPLHELSERYLFAAHMVQHLLLTLVVPPLLLAGAPAPVIDRWLCPILARRPLRALSRAGTRPLAALGLHAVALFVWHLPAVYDAALGSHPLHVLQHATLTATAALAWWPVLSRSRLLPPLPYAAQILYLFVFGVPMTIVAAMVTVASDPLYRFYAAAPRLVDITPLDDQRLGGVIMWVPAGLVPLLAFTAVFFRWAASEPEEPPAGG